MSEQGDWHFVEEDIGPALENKTSYSTLSDDSDENLQFMEASLTESFLQSKNEEIQLPLPIAKMDCIQEITAAGAVEDERIRTEERSDVLIPSSQGENKYEGRKIQPATTTRTSVMVAPAATSIIVILLAGSVLASSLILDMLEIEVLSASHRLTHHDLRLTSLESKVNELTEMMLKISSCGAHFYKNNPAFDFSKAVHGGRFSEGLLVEGRTKIYTPHGSTSKDLIHASHQCINEIDDDKCTPEFQAEPVAEKIIAGSGGSEKTAKFLENNNDAEDDATIKDTTKLDIDKLRDRIAALEHGMDAIHLLLSSSSDGVDQELATLSATIWRLQEKVEELEGIW
ncbi:hypothetical protein NADE_008384 [Nannochloris sp. 'desiccata']|nr:hypothetical protein KSW81_006289 [Chlorella desiccata (nom. nud.)]KAG7674622.1 hypothetical protein KSW81_000268 [Chlorella desiccata (nom. nud.)]KAH7620110.1 hypothetical protein NADE_008384 [Chlorella desiccata (nom. nud.)]